MTPPVTPRTPEPQLGTQWDVVTAAAIVATAAAAAVAGGWPMVAPRADR
tara:strand:- start:346 stop:492 length:147 start_codon:yes stop_codon:yes gene_type:complete